LLLGGALPLVLLVSYVSFKLIEQPFQRRREGRQHGRMERGGGLLDRIDPLLVLLAWAMLLMVALEFLS
jgi:peptidoglycan/LPS O-acetylase OafA/YrhL